jgi:dihydrodipicolinate synthase/N-acetylneuraminate lyase
VKGSPTVEPMDLLRPRRTVTGMSAVLLPYSDPRTPDLDGLRAHLERTQEAGLVPALNMDTGYGPTLDDEQRVTVLELARSACAGAEFVAGAHVDDSPGDALDLDRYRRQVELIAGHGGTPILFPSHGLGSLDEDGRLAAMRSVGESCDRFLGFELSRAFHPAGFILSIDGYRELLAIDACVGAKHSSLERQPEWDRLRLRDEVRPEFMVLTGNDLAIDMVCYGSDYLLGISTFAPDLFAERDRRWTAGDPSFHRLNDDLQYLGRFTFRTPVPAYKHSAAQFLALRGWLDGDTTPDGAPRRPDADVAVLREIGGRLGVLDGGAS